MKKIFKLLVIVAITLPLMASCSGGSSKESIIFGTFPSVFEKYLKEKEKLEAEKGEIKTEADKAEFLKKVEELKGKWAEKLETAAKTADGQTLEFAESNIKVTEPISLQFEKLDKDLEPVYLINGKAEAASDLQTYKSIAPNTEIVYLKGYDEQGNELFSTKVGNMTGNTDKEAIVSAGEPVNFTKLYFSEKNVEGYLNAKSLKLVMVEAKPVN